MQRTTDLILTAAKLGMAVLMIAAFVWVLNRSLPRQTPGRSQGEVLAPIPTEGTPSLGANTATPPLSATPTEIVSKQRTEVITYTVQPGDTIIEIAEMFQLKPETIFWGNYEVLADDSQALKVGMEINILPVDGVYYEWKEGDDLNEVASRFGVGVEDIVDWVGNRLKPETLGELSNPNIEPGTMLVIPGGKREFSP